MNLYAIALRTDPKDPGWSLFVTSDESRRTPPGDTHTWCVETWTTREEAIGALLNVLSHHGLASAVYVQDINKAEFARLAHQGNSFSLLNEMPEGVATFLGLTEILVNQEW